MFDAHKNLAISSVAVAPSPPASGLTMSVAAGEGMLYPAPPFNATVWPFGVIPSATNAEIVRVTARTGDDFTLLRAQEGTTARAIVMGDLLVATVTAKTLTDMESGQFFPLIDLPEGIPVDPPPDTARLYALDVNGYTQVEIRDGAAKVVRLASDNVIVAKVSGVPVVRGQCLYLAGASGANPIIGLAKADALTTLPCVGIAMDDGAVNAFVRVLVAGTLQKLDTSAFAEGAALFVSPTTAGSFTTTRPVAPALAQRVGFVTRSHASSGEVLILTTAVDVPKTFRQGHTWGLLGDVSSLTVLPSMFVQKSPGQAIAVYGLVGKIASGTRIDVQLTRNGVAMGNVFWATPTYSGIALPATLLNDNDELTLVLANPIGTPTTLSMTLLLEHTL
jgi:hypothetical protein